MKQMNENRNLISMRQRRLIRQLNKEIQAKKERRIAAKKILGAILTACLVIICALVMICAAEIQAAEEAQAAVLRDFRINPDIKATYPHSPNAGLEASDPWMVESIPDVPPDHGEPPEAIEIKMASKAEQIPTDSNALNALEQEEEHWESLGVWKLTAYCPLECCNGKGNAWKTASCEPMKVGDTVAVTWLPFGTKIKIRGHVYTVMDTGKLNKYQVDILFPSHSSANDFGIQYDEVFILRKSGDK